MDPVAVVDPKLDRAPAPASPGGGSAKPLIPPIGEDGVLKAVVDLVDDSYRWKSLLHALHARCCAFYEGYQNVVWSAQRGQFVPNTMYPRTIKPTMENRIKPTVEHAVSILASVQPSFIVPPRSGSPKDLSIADIQSAVVEKIATMLDTPTWDEDVKRWACKTGTVAVESEFQTEAGEWDVVFEEDENGDPVLDPTTGDPIPQYETDKMGAPLLDANQQPKVLRRPKGAIQRTLYTSLEQFPDPSSTGYDNAAWCAFAFTLSAREAERRFKIESEELSKIQGEGPWQKISMLLRRTFSPFGQGVTVQSAANASGPVLGLKFHQAPCKEAPSGRCIVILGGKVIYDEPSQTQGRFRFPFQVFHHERHAKRWFSLSMVETLLDLQEELNRVLTRYSNTTRLMSNPKIMIPADAGLDQKSITDKEGEVWRYNPGPSGEKPEFLQGMSMPPSVMAYIEHLIQAIEWISGINDASRGVLPSSDTSGRAIQALQSRDSQRLGKIAISQSKVWANVLRYELFLAGNYWPDKKKIRLVGRNLRPFMLTFDKSMFSEPVEEIEVEAGEGLPRDPVDRQKFINDMFAPQGAMMTLPPDMRRQYVVLSKNASVRTLLTRESAYELSVRVQLDQCRQGQQVQVNYNSDHNLARALISEFMESDEWRESPDQVKALIADMDRQHAYWSTQPKDERGITLPPDIVLPGPPTPSPGQVPSTLEVNREAAGAPPAAQPQGSPPSPAGAG